ncbi:hypothetical protein ACFTAO_48420 [Paenibacillus rhizoplanae]
MMLNLTLNLYAARNNLRNESVSNMKITAKQVAVSVEQSGYSSNYVQDKIAQNLRLTAILASYELDPDIRNINNEQLKALSTKLGVSNISLLVKTADDIIVARSSDPSEIGLSTRGMGFFGMWLSWSCLQASRYLSIRGSPCSISGPGRLNTQPPIRSILISGVIIMTGPAIIS